MSTPTKAPTKKTPTKKTPAKKTPAKKPTTKRTSVPAPAQTTGATTTLDALAAQPAGTQVHEIPVDAIDPHPSNPRADVGDLAELVDSIKAHGIRQNLVLVPHEGRYRAVIGHRRHAAAKAAGLSTVPAVVDHELDERAQLELMLLENIQRSDLTVIEEANGYQGLLDLGATFTQIAKQVGRSKTTVETRVALLTLPKDAQDKVATHQASLTDAAALAEFDDLPAQQDQLARLLGTHSFDWELRKARIQAKHERVIRELVALLPELAAIPRGEDTWLGGDGLQRVGSVDLDQVAADSDADGAQSLGAVATELTTILVGADDTWRWNLWGALTVWRPREVVSDTQSGPEIPAPGPSIEELERRKEFAERVEFTKTAASARRDFVQEAARRKKWSNEHTSRLLDELAAACIDGLDLYGFDVAAALGFDEDSTTHAAIEEAYSEGTSVRALLRGEGYTAQGLALAVIAEANETHATNEYTWGPETRNVSSAATVLAWYDLLRLLGYRASQEEEARLAVVGASLDAAP